MRRFVCAAASSWLVGLGSFEVKIEAGEFHVRGFGDFDVALGAVDDVDVGAEPLDETGFVGGVDPVGGGFGESFFQESDEKNLRSLGEDHTFAGNGAGDERDILRQAAALHFLDSVHGRRAEDGCSPFPSFFDDAGNLFASDERANRVVYRNQFHVIADMIESRGDRLLPRGSSFDHANRLGVFFVAETLFQALDFIGAGGDDDLTDGVAGGSAAHGVKKYGRAVQFEELFGRFAAHARAHSSGGQDGSDSGHWIWGAV